jgi:ribosomal-protein-alanine N-acetyltransferase
MIYLETDRLIVRDYVEEDFLSYYRLKSNEKTMYYLQDIKMDSEESARIDFEKVLADSKEEKRRFYFFHVESKDKHEPVGSAGYTVTEFTPVGQLVHAGYFSFPTFWNSGYITEAFARIIEFAFAENNVYRIATGCLKENLPSERVMQKCGLIKEAEHLNSEWHDGNMKTRVEYRLLKEEWLNKQF